MTIPQWHELANIVFIVLAIELIGLLALYEFAEITYKLAHKNSKKTNTKLQRRREILVNV